MRSGQGLDINYSVLCIRLDKTVHQEQKENSISKTTRKATGNHLSLFFLRHDMDGRGLKDNGINQVVSQGLAESRLAGCNHVRRSRSSSSEILTTRVERKKFHLRIGCWNVRTLLQKGKLENAKHEMARSSTLSEEILSWHSFGLDAFL